MYSFVGGVAIAMLPSLYLFAMRPDSYVFDNLGYHAIRSAGGLFGHLDEKIGTLILATMLGPPGNGLQMGVLLLLYVVAVVKIRCVTGSLAFQLGAALGIISLLPTPAYLQYWCVVIPFLVVAVVCAGNAFLVSRSRRSSLRVVLAGMALFAIYLAAPIGDYETVVMRGNGIGLPNEPAVNWKPETVAAVSKTIDKLAVRGEEVVSFWPGYVIASKASEMPGLENDSGLACSRVLTSAQRSRYHIVSRDDIEAQITARVPRIVVLGNQEYIHQRKEPYESVLVHSGYHVAAVIGDTAVYTL